MYCMYVVGYHLAKWLNAINLLSLESAKNIPFVGENDGDLKSRFSSYLWSLWRSKTWSWWLFKLIFSLNQKNRMEAVCVDSPVSWQYTDNYGGIQLSHLFRFFLIILNLDDKLASNGAFFLIVSYCFSQQGNSSWWWNRYVTIYAV